MKKLFIFIFGLFAVLLCFSFSTNVYASDVELPSNSTPFTYLSINDFEAGNYDLANINSGRSASTNNRYCSSSIIEATPKATYRLYFHIAFEYTRRVTCRAQLFDSDKVYLDTIVSSWNAYSSDGYNSFDFTLPDYVSYMFISVNFNNASAFTDMSSIMDFANLYRITGENDPSPIAWYNTALILADPYQVGVNYYFTFSKNNLPWDGTGSYDVEPTYNYPLLYYAGSNSKRAVVSYKDGSTIVSSNFFQDDVPLSSDGSFLNFCQRMFYSPTTGYAQQYSLAWSGDLYTDINLLLSDINSSIWSNGYDNIAYVSWATSTINYGSYYFGVSTNLTLSFDGLNVTPTDSTYITRCSNINPSFVLPNYKLGLDNSSFLSNNPYASMFWIGIIEKSNSDIVHFNSSTNDIASNWALPYDKVIQRFYDIFEFDIFSKVIANACYSSSSDWTYSYSLYVPLYNSYSEFYSSTYNPIIDFRVRLWNEVVPPAFGTFEPTESNLWTSWTGLYHLFTSIVVFVNGSGMLIAEINPIYTYVVVLFIALLCLDMIRRFNVF